MAPKSRRSVERYAAARGSSIEPGHVQELLDAAFARSRTPEELAKGRDLSTDEHRRCECRDAALHDVTILP